MSKYLRTNGESQKKFKLKTSAFAQQVLPHVGGSCVYIEPKKVKRKFIDVEAINNG